MKATLSWTKPADEDLAGFKIYVGLSPGNYYTSVTLTNPQTGGGLIASWTLLDLPDGRPIYFAVSALDATGNESTKSNEVSKINKYTTFTL